MNLSSDSLPTLNRTTTWLIGSVFILSSLATFGGLTAGAFGFDLANWINQEAFTGAGLTFTYATVMSLLSVVAIYLANAEDISDIGDTQGSMSLILLLTVVVSSVSPEIVSWVSAENSRGLIFVALQTLLFLGVAEDSGSMIDSLRNK